MRHRIRTSAFDVLGSTRFGPCAAFPSKAVLTSSSFHRRVWGRSESSDISAIDQNDCPGATGVASRRRVFGIRIAGARKRDRRREPLCPPTPGGLPGLSRRVGFLPSPIAPTLCVQCFWVTPPCRCRQPAAGSGVFPRSCEALARVLRWYSLIEQSSREREDHDVAQKAEKGKPG